MHYVKILLFVFLTSSLFGAVDFPQVYSVFEKTNDEDRIKKMILSSDKKRLLVMRHNSISLMDAKSLKLLKTITFIHSAWDCAFIEKGFILLTNFDFSYYDDTGTKRLYYEERRHGVNTARHYLDDIRKNILKVSTENNTNDYINILARAKVSSFPDDNVVPNGKQIIDIKELSLKDIVDNKVVQTYVKPAGYIRFGCMDPSGKRFAILAENKPVYVYDMDKSESIFSLPENLNTSKTQGCLLYDDTLILWGNSMQVYNLKDTEKIKNAVAGSLKVMPIIGSCTDASHSVSLWVSTMYGWDVQKGKMLWYSAGPYLNRNHWENAGYLIKMQSDNKSSIIQPYGDHKELKVNLEDGSFIELGDKKDEKLTQDSVVCNPGTGELWLEKEFSFIHNDVSFYALSRGEWLVVSNKDGYFNTSSKNALMFLHKDDAALTDEDIKKWYRPDIIEAKLSNTEILNQVAIKTNYTLPESSELKNQYLTSILQGIKTGNNYKSLMSLIKETELEQIGEIVDAIPNDEKGYFYFYSALKNKRFPHKQSELFGFLNKRVENLSTHSNEVPALLEYLMTYKAYKEDAEFKKNREAFTEKLLTKFIANERVKLMIAATNKTDEAYKVIYWDVWERENYITKEHLQVLYQENPLKAQELAIKSLIIMLNKIKLLGCTEDQLNTDICQDSFEMRTYGTYWTRIKTLYDFLITDTTPAHLDELKRITAEKVKKFYADYEPDKLGINTQYIKFYLKYSNEAEKKQLIKSTKDYIEKEIFNTDWKRYWSDESVRNKGYKIGALKNAMLETMPDYFLQLELKVIASGNESLQKNLAYILTDIDKNPKVQQAMIRSIEQQYHDNGSLNDTYIRSLLNTDNKDIHLQVIKMLNELKVCDKVVDAYRYKLKNVLSLQEYRRLECALLPNESVPNKKKEEYAPLSNQIQQNPQVQIAAKVSYEGLDAESVEIAGTTAFVSSGNRGVDILDITNPDSPIRLSTLSLPGRVMQTHLYGKLLCALQSDHYLEAKKGWISIINVSDPVHPKVLSTLTLDERPYETASNGNLLAVATVRGNSQGKEILLYDMTNPSHLKSMPPIRLKVPTRSLAFSKSVLYVGSSDLFEFYAYDTAKKGNKEVLHRNEHKKWVQDIQIDGRTMAIMSDQTIYLYPLSSTLGNASVSTIRIENDFALFKVFALYKGYLFAAERERGVRIYDISVLEKPKLVRRVPFDGALIRNVGVSEGSLFGVDTNGNVHRKDITDLFRKSVTILIKGPAEEPRPKKETSRRQILGQEQIQTYLYIAARDNDISMANEMLQQMGSINGRGHELFSPIEIASRIGNNEVLELMLQKGNKPDWKSQKAGMLAALGGHGDTLRLLERYGAPMNFKDPWDQCTPLHYAAQNCDVETVKFMISKKADPDAVCRKNEKPINWAGYGANLRVIDYLTQVMKR